MTRPLTQRAPLGGQNRRNAQSRRRKLQTIIVRGLRRLIRSAHERNRIRGLNSSRQEFVTDGPFGGPTVVRQLRPAVESPQNYQAPPIVGRNPAHYHGFGVKV